MHEMTSGDLRVTIDEATGGAIATFTAGDFAILRGVADFRLEAEHGRPVGAYPLIPYANRIAGGRFSYGGEDFQLGLNFAGHPNSLHGNAWMRVWEIVSADGTHVHLVLDHRPPRDPVSQWPYAYRTEMKFSLDPAGLTVDMSIRNDDARPFPAGLGLHPYVSREPGVTLQFDADTVWQNGSDALPILREAVSGHWDFTRTREVTNTQIDECYAGWGGRAEVHWPSVGRRLVIEAGLPFDHIQLYTPPLRDFFGLEPVSNMPDAINRMEQVADGGLRVLAPGEVLSGTIRMGMSITSSPG